MDEKEFVELAEKFVHEFLKTRTAIQKDIIQSLIQRVREQLECRTKEAYVRHSEAEIELKDFCGAFPNDGPIKTDGSFWR